MGNTRDSKEFGVVEMVSMVIQGRDGVTWYYHMREPHLVNFSLCYVSELAVSRFLVTVSCDSEL